MFMKISSPEPMVLCNKCGSYHFPDVQCEDRKLKIESINKDELKDVICASKGDSDA